MKYRPEIDGLRALAIIPVILFHAGFVLFGGGFVGVDVFFVISGYLITTILIEDLENKRFSILNFYERRVRRILPALFVVMLVTVALAWMWMIPSQMAQFSRSVLSTSLFFSNVLFWHETGYFKTPGQEKPLLHTWSLAVEEQYYVLFPIFLFLMWRFRKERVFWMIVVLASISLALSEWGWRHKPVANFYLAPTRAWEIFAGSIAAFIVQKRGVKANNFMSMLGLAAILFAIFAYDKHVPFPSVYALVPVVGVVLLVLYADKETLAAKILSTRVLVGIGLISYSAYLWHQPLFVFARLRAVHGASASLFIFLSLASLVLGYLSWKYVERPFRNRAFLSKPQLFSMAAVGTLAFVAFGHYGYEGRGYPSRLNKAEAKFLDYFENSAPKWRYFARTNMVRLYRNACNFYNSPANRYGANTLVPRKIDPSCVTVKSPNAKTLFLWGDSYAMSLNYGFTENLKKDWEILQVASSGCAPTIGKGDSDIDYCRRSNYFAFKEIKKIKPTVVLLKYNMAQDPRNDPLSLVGISKRLLEVGVKHVIVMGPNPHWNPTLPLNLLRFWPSLPSRTYFGTRRDSSKSTKNSRRHSLRSMA